MRQVWTFLARTLAWMVILAAVTVIAAAVVIPRLRGATPYTITTGSMAPTYPPGTLVAVRPVGPEDLSVGDVVTVQLESGRDTVVTHRIAAIQHRMDGDLQFVTKGDANDVVDAEVRMPVQIRGEVWYFLPYVGYVSLALTGIQRQWIVTALAVGLFGYAGWMFVGAWRERRHRLAAESATAPSDEPAVSWEVSSPAGAPDRSHPG